MLNIFEDSAPTSESDVLERASKGLVTNVLGMTVVSINITGFIDDAYGGLCDRVARDGASSAKAYLIGLISSPGMPLGEASALDTFADSLCGNDFFECAEAQEGALGRAFQDLQKAKEHSKNADDRLNDTEAAWRIGRDQFREVAKALAEWGNDWQAQRDSERPLPTFDFSIPKYVSLSDELQNLGGPVDFRINAIFDAIVHIRRAIIEARNRNFPGVPVGLAKVGEEFRKLCTAASAVVEARYRVEHARKECESVKEHYVKLRGQLQADMKRCAGTIGASALYEYYSRAGRGPILRGGEAHR